MCTNDTFWHWNRHKHKHKLTHRAQWKCVKMDNFLLFFVFMYMRRRVIIAAEDSNDDSYEMYTCSHYRTFYVLHLGFYMWIIRLYGVLFIMWKIIMKIIFCNASVCLAVGFRYSIPFGCHCFWQAFVLRRFFTSIYICFVLLTIPGIRLFAEHVF